MKLQNALLLVAILLLASAPLWFPDIEPSEERMLRNLSSETKAALQRLDLEEGWEYAGKIQLIRVDMGILGPSTAFTRTPVLKNRNYLIIRGFLFQASGDVNVAKLKLIQNIDVFPRYTYQGLDVEPKATVLRDHNSTIHPLK